MNKIFSIGIDDFKKYIDNNYYYVDKSNLICDLLNNHNKVTLITRPRRFGKSLNMSMLRYFFEKSKEDTSYLFNGLEVSKNERYMKEQGKYPVIYLSFQSVKAKTFEKTIEKFSKVIAELFKYHQNSIDFEKMTPREKNHWKTYTNGTTDNVYLANSLLFLCECLEEAYNQQVIILIDDYDVPLDNAYSNGFYDNMINLISLLVESATKGNPSSKMAVLTGCLRIAKENIFSGLNNLVEYSVLHNYYSQYYGFTENEVKQLLQYYHLENKFDIIKTWYGGYLWGNQEIYNPWSVLYYIRDFIHDDTAQPLPYWCNSISNSIISKVLVESCIANKHDLEDLVNGEVLTKPLYENFTCNELDTNSLTIWSFLLHMGYLKIWKSFRYDGSVSLMGKFAIPNLEILTLFNIEIKHWIKNILTKNAHTYILNALLEKNPKLLEEHINDWLIKTISYQDTTEKESFYYNILLGLFSNFDDFKVISTHKSCKERFDIILKNYKLNTTIIVGFKLAEAKKDLVTEYNKALQQIEYNHYDTELINEGYTNILKYGIAFFKKMCMVMIANN